MKIIVKDKPPREGWYYVVTREHHNDPLFIQRLHFDGEKYWDYFGDNPYEYTLPIYGIVMTDKESY